MGGIDPGGLGRALEDAIRMLGQATESAAAAPGDPPAATALVGRGTSHTGLVEAEVAALGRLESLVIDPGLLRAGAAAIAEQVVEAVRAAQDDEQARRAETLGAAGDPAALTRQLERVSEEAYRGFDRMIGDLDAITRRMDRR
ncbi:YbaB/EbfC family nucleoid-associated protein [Asanoa sp. WMMD1127]|uniref:YbaB/EbfC family nucleoid-associated protein n=1 Tax=Asanoa sp. WMMD1127 TaxID=3016107 RepID=UPI002415C295|nr:YbaB/EbfC family nucleoid-associated protein [Asanoa sp. WMMD1127]MDG4825402.1 YbaB/EbfC family nucleoid-associated protein [Asanoa sp. WMMD1127]